MRVATEAKVQQVSKLPGNLIILLPTPMQYEHDLYTLQTD